MPAVEPHSRPAGRSPQLGVTPGAGLEIPTPEIGLAPEPGTVHAASTTDRQLTSTGNSILGDDMTTPWLNIVIVIESNWRIEAISPQV